MPHTPATLKAQLRKTLLARRAAQSAEVCAAASHAAQQHLLADPAWQAAQQVVLYMPIRNELDTTLLLDAAWNAGKTVFLPRCEPDCPGEMCLAPCTCTADLAPGAYGIHEPHPARCPAVNPDAPGFAPNLAVIPGVAFTRAGLRLGFGGGYYDRFLARPALANTRLVGFAYTFQIVDALPAEPWDRPVHALCTETSLTWL